MLQQFRERAGLSQGKLAQDAGLSQQFISHLETGERSAQEMGLSRARAIVDALNRAGIACELDDVFPPTSSTNEAA